MPLDVVIEKHPSEVFTLGLDFIPRLPPGTNIVAGSSVAVFDEEGLDVTATILVSPTPTIQGSALLVTVRNGDTGVVYKIIYTAVLNSGSQVIQDGLSLAVKAL